MNEFPGLVARVLALALLALAAGCQQQATTLSGWVSEGSESTIVLLERPEVELASAPVAAATFRGNSPTRSVLSVAEGASGAND